MCLHQQPRFLLRERTLSLEGSERRVQPQQLPVDRVTPLPSPTDVIPTDKVEVGFKDIDAAILVGSMPRKEGMERKDLLKANVAIFKTQGAALDKYAKKTVKVRVGSAQATLGLEINGVPAGAVGGVAVCEQSLIFQVWFWSRGLGPAGGLRPGFGAVRWRRQADSPVLLPRFWWSETQQTPTV